MAETLTRLRALRRIAPAPTPSCEGARRNPCQSTPSDNAPWGEWDGAAPIDASCPSTRQRALTGFANFAFLGGRQANSISRRRSKLVRFHN